MSESIRLQKYLSACGVTSRRKAEELIISGRVSVDGHIAVLGDKIDPDTAVVTLDGKRITNTDRRVYLAIYKPRGYLSSVSDDRGRKCVTDLVKEKDIRLYPVGRLDYDSEGLLLLTNDGELANALTHPRYKVEKSYIVTVSPAPSSEQLQELASGVDIDGRRTAKAKISVRSSDEDRAVVRFIIHEGRNRQIRRMCEALGLEVLRLKRVAEDAVRLGSLKPGEYRELTEDEIRAIRKKVCR
ncbi:MAG: rRNA pseudouridine synthase [Clostridia bacterium]|nr:rRNA pseudouridine synthase [Clostridia bacterium]